MTTQLDYTVGIGKESAYGVPAAPTRFYESEAKMNAEIETVQGAGLRPAKRVNRANRNTISRVSVAGDIDIEVSDQTFGFLLEAAVGSPTVTGSASAGYEHKYVLRKTDPVPSYTIEEVVPFIGGSQDSGPQKFVGCVAESLTIEVSEGGYVTAKISWLGRELILSGTATAATYPASDALLRASADGSYVAASGDAAMIIKAFSVTIKNNLDSGGYGIAGGTRRSRKQEIGRADVTGSFTAELSSAYLRSRTLDRQSFVLNVVLESGRAIGGLIGGLSIVMPAVRVKGGIPQSNGGSVPEITAEFEAFDNGTQEPITISYLTADAAP